LIQKLENSHQLDLLLTSEKNMILDLMKNLISMNELITEALGIANSTIALKTEIEEFKEETAALKIFVDRERNRLTKVLENTINQKDKAYVLLQDELSTMDRKYQQSQIRLRSVEALCAKLQSQNLELSEEKANSSVTVADDERRPSSPPSSSFKSPLSTSRTSFTNKKSDV